MKIHSTIASLRADLAEVRRDRGRSPTAHVAALVVLAAAYLGGTRLIDNLEV